MSSERRTRTADDAPAVAAAAPHAYLALAFACDRPTEPPARWHLAGDILLSGAAPAGMTAGQLACDDPWASTRHAVVRMSFGRWRIEDQDSKNGTFVNGARITRETLSDGDLIEIGHTGWWFREIVLPAAPPDLVADLDAPFVTLHAPLADALARATAAIAANLAVLVSGESGTGKERFAAALHAASRRSGAFVPVNCGALPAALVEGELFGHRRGAFSGALEDRAGYIRAADRGTLFLDEVGDMPLAAQAALLRVLAERAVTPVGDERPIPVDVALISATHRDLGAMVTAASFRADLLARLRGLSLALPALRDRREDIAIFVARTLRRIAPHLALAPDAARAIALAPWPLNVRELESTVGAAAVRALARGPRTPLALADLDTLPAAPAPAAPAAPAALSPEDTALRARLVAALVEHAGNISAVARALDRDRKQIHRWLERFAIDPRAPR